MRILHVLHSLSAEGSPRLALALLEQARSRGDVGAVLPLVNDPDDLRQEFEKAGIPIFEPVGWTGRDYLSMVIRMRRVLRGETFDGIVCYTVGPHISIASVARMLGFPFLLHLGNAPPDDSPARTKLKWLLRIGRHLVTAHVACSHYVRDRVISDYGMPEKAVVTILNGIDIGFFQEIRSARRADDSSLLFGMVGSFEAHKDQSTLVRALRALVDEGVEARLEFIGKGTNESHLRGLSEKLRVNHLIRWSGTTSDVREALGRFDVFAYSVGPEEGLGIALIEALAAGIPCVCSDVGACREVLQRGELGRLIASRDPRTWASAILEAKGSAPIPVERLVRFDIAATAVSYEGLLEGRRQ